VWSQNSFLSADKLEEWPWQVAVALAGHGFEVHGQPVNRPLQKKLIEDAKSSGLCT
jgi:hypothetical protein